ncbi:WYL domain-containing protein [Membranicola marinus]|uniref:WYL domain-containing protein n=1 Tax=Membranihabitans marinus TaxID=1227546 RepID=A0A953L9L3_9BACT|nr:WYL domain-containing protein [Membranihabitans marinus]MBY5958965.1 WYL domain-containing protein [Membranihabitans marinus]
MKRTEKQIINCFKSLNLLSRGSTMNDLAVRLNVSTRTAYRYLTVLKNAGFLFEEIGDHTYKLIQAKRDKHISISFTQQEVEYITSRITENAPAYKSIYDKLYIHSDILQLPNKVLAADFGRTIRMLDRAIRAKKRVTLVGYSSAHSNDKDNYKVEPIQLEDNYQRLYAYDLKAKKVHQYKTERIEKVELLNESQWFTQDYSDKIETDCFGWMIEDTTWDIELEMSRGAYHIIKEENPGIAQFSSELSDNRFLLQATVANLLPVTSIILRLPGEIRVIRPKVIEAEAAKRLQKLDFLEKYYTPLT